MSGISRREFGTLVVAGLPLSQLRPTRLEATSQLTLGVTTASFRDLPRVTGRDNVDDVIRAIRALRVTDIELSLANVEPAPPSVAPFMGGTPAYPRVVVLTPEEIARTNAQARAALRAWRLRTGPELFEHVRAKLASAPVAVHACAVSYTDDFTDEEIDATFRQVAALGVRTVSSPLTMAMARRLVPFAERHQVSVAIHNQVDGTEQAAIGTSAVRSVLALSPIFRLKLDIGNITASNGDAVAELGELRDRVSHVVIKDRLRNGGRSQPFGEGDTPIRRVVALLRAGAPSVPALIEYDYIGLRGAVDEVAAAIDYLQAAG
jgi:sugar phosphate isomerase/epimerase